MELANGEVVYLPMSFETSAEMVGKLYVRTADGEEKVLDENASVIYAYSDNAVYYNKLEDSKLVQTRYMDGELTPVFGDCRSGQHRCHQGLLRQQPAAGGAAGRRPEHSGGRLHL